MSRCQFIVMCACAANFELATHIPLFIKVPGARASGHRTSALAEAVCTSRTGVCVYPCQNNAFIYY